MVLALIFSELLGGGVLLVSFITGHTPQEVIKGEADSVLSLKDTKPISSKESGTSSSTSNTADTVGGGGSGGGTVGEAAPNSKPAPPPNVAGSLTWKSLEKEIKEGKLTPTQVDEKLETLTGKKVKPSKKTEGLKETEA